MNNEKLLIEKYHDTNCINDVSFKNNLQYCMEPRIESCFEETLKYLTNNEREEFMEQGNYDDSQDYYCCSSYTAYQCLTNIHKVC